MFCNITGGRLLIGVGDNGIVYGIPCNRKQEDIMRIQIDSIIGKFHPPIFPDMYSVTFIPVLPHVGYRLSRDDENVLKVLEIKIKAPIRGYGTLFETDKGEVFVKRDGSVQGPLKASQIIEWCKRFDTIEKNDNELFLEPITKSEGKTKVSKKGKSDFYSLNRLTEIEANIRKRQQYIEKEVATMRNHYEAREKALQAELERSKYELSKERKKKRPKSATCRIL